MSTTSTPSRRCADVPSIDTHFDSDKHTTALSYAGCLTPPQSAHESRRGSLAYDAFQDVSYSNGVALNPLSQPVTPIQAISPNLQHFPQQWHQHASSQALHSVQHDTAYPMQPVTASFIAASLTQAANTVSDFGLSEHLPLEQAWPGSQRMDWTPQHQYSHVPDYSVVSLSSSLLQSQTCSSITARHGDSSYNGSFFPDEHLSLNAVHGDVFETSSAHAVHPQQVTVAPSMLTPGDGYVLQPYQEYSSLNGSRQSLASSFATTHGSFSSTEYDIPMSPPDAYAYSDEDYVPVKGEFPSPTPGMSRTMSKDSRVARRRRSTTRGPRTTHGQRYHSHWIGGAATGIKCEIVGDACDITYDQGGFNIPATITKQGRKMHRCNHIKAENGEPCLRAFERGEHLKRHMASHSTNRRYGCGLPECKHIKGISRGDNAGDHFRTHLKSTEKGRRNKFFEWPQVRAVIETRYDKKESKRLITNLTKWIRTREEGRCQRHHLKDIEREYE